MTEEEIERYGKPSNIPRPKIRAGLDAIEGKEMAK